MTAEIGSASVARASYTKTPIRQIIRKPPKSTQASSQFSSTLRSFAAPGTQLRGQAVEESDDELEDESGPESAASEEASPNLEEPQQTVRSHTRNRDETRDRLVDTEASEAEHDDSDLQEDGDNAEPVEKDAESDDEYLDEETKKAKEEAKVARLIHDAEEKAAIPLQDNLKRTMSLLKGGNMREPTANLRQSFNTSTKQIDAQFRLLVDTPEGSLHEGAITSSIPSETPTSAEERLSLTISKADFASMHIIGQFNLGFIIALRPAHLDPSAPSASSDLNSSDELFIIDQHASDEKYNFERLQATTIVQNQRLVQPQPLDLTAIEEEIVIENEDVLVKNGFLLSVDESGDVPVGKRCRLLSLPMSKEVTFSTRDLEELLVLLAESPLPSTFAFVSKMTDTDSGSWATQNQHIPRPSAIRRIFAMRACRSSVMIGKTLTKLQMEKLVSKMGELEKPWNCPHGRPTMRHLAGLDGWDSWKEGDGRGIGSAVGLDDDDGKDDQAEGNDVDEVPGEAFWERGRAGAEVRWAEWLAGRSGAAGEDGESEDEDGKVGQSGEDGEAEQEDSIDEFEDLGESAGKEGEEFDLPDGDDNETRSNILDRFSYNLQ